MNKQTEATLDQSGLPADLIAKMKRSVSVTAERCYLHPESPTGYVGRGKWCQHRPGHTVTMK